MTVPPPVFYSKPYNGRVTDYVPDSHRTEFSPTPVLAVETDNVTNTDRTRGHTDGVRTRWQGRYSDQRPHNYAYGRSKPHLRPEIDEVSDLEWLATLHKPTARHLAVLRRLGAV